MYMIYTHPSLHQVHLCSYELCIVFSSTIRLKKQCSIGMVVGTYAHSPIVISLSHTFIMKRPGKFWKSGLENLALTKTNCFLNFKKTFTHFTQIYVSYFLLLPWQSLPANDGVCKEPVEQAHKQVLCLQEIRSCQLKTIRPFLEFQKEKVY